MNSSAAHAARGPVPLVGVRRAQIPGARRRGVEPPAPRHGALGVRLGRERDALVAERLGEGPEMHRLHALEQPLDEGAPGGLREPLLQPARPALAEERRLRPALVLFEGGAHPGLERVLAQEVRGEGVDGADLEAVELGERARPAAARGGGVAELLEPAAQLRHPLARHEPREPRPQAVAHLVRRPHREGEGEEPRRLDVGREELPEQELDDARRLAGPRARLDRGLRHRPTTSQYAAASGAASGFRPSRP
jgi:hypothetical protein